MKTELTFCIPAYNYGHYLEQCLRSVLQSGKEFEVVVLDNGSSDGTQGLRAIFEADSRVTWFRNEETIPIQENWNKAVSLASSDWVKLLQADDFLLPSAVERLLELIRIYASKDFIGHYASFVNAEGKITRDQQMHGLLPLSLSGKEALRAKLRQLYRFKEPSSNLFRKSAWQTVGGYGRDRRFTFDVSFNVRLMSAVSSVLVPERLVAVRRHGASDGAKLPANLALRELITLTDDIMDRIGPGITLADRSSAIGWTQFRMLELLAQKFRLNKRDAGCLIAGYYTLPLNVLGWPGLFKLIYRRVTYGDLQGKLTQGHGS